MKPEDITAFINAINMAQPYIPPLIFDRIVKTTTCNALVAAANGMIEFEAKSKSAPPEK